MASKGQAPAHITKEEAAALIGMDMAEYERLWNANSAWKYPADNDGWANAHNCIRADLKDLSAALKVIRQRVADGLWLSALERSFLLHFWHMVSQNIHHHHDHEEQYFFPAMEKKFRVPEDGYVTPHKTLMEGMDLLEEQFKNICALESASEALLDKLLAMYEPWKAAVEEHLAHEELTNLPMMRKHFTQKEVAKIYQQFLSKLPMDEHAHFFGRMSDEQRKAFFKQEGIPGFAQALFIMPAVRKWQRKYEVPMKQLIAGEQLSAPKKRWLCFAA